MLACSGSQVQAATLRQKLSEQARELDQVSKVRADLEAVIAREEDGACDLAQRKKVAPVCNYAEFRSASCSLRAVPVHVWDRA